jgi:hypothetical protein
LLDSILSTFAGLYPFDIYLAPSFQHLLDSILSTFACLRSFNISWALSIQYLLDSLLSTFAGLPPFNICWTPSYQRLCNHHLLSTPVISVFQTLLFSLLLAPWCSGNFRIIVQNCKESSPCSLLSIKRCILFGQLAPPCHVSPCCLVMEGWRRI